MNQRLYLNLTLINAGTASWGEWLEFTHCLPLLDEIGKVQSAELRRPPFGPTMVADITGVRQWWPQVWHLAWAFGQDAVAVWLPECQSGCLIGPRAPAWEPFNTAAFILPSTVRSLEHEPV